MALKITAALGTSLRGSRGARPDLGAEHRRHVRRDSADHPLQDRGAKVRAYDPVGMEQAKIAVRRDLSDDPSGCAGRWTASSSSAWEQFRALDLDQQKRSMTSPVIVDLRTSICPQMIRRGFAYKSVGRPGSKAIST